MKKIKVNSIITVNLECNMNTQSWVRIFFTFKKVPSLKTGSILRYFKRKVKVFDKNVRSKFNFQITDFYKKKKVDQSDLRQLFELQGK